MKTIKKESMHGRRIAFKKQVAGFAIAVIALIAFLVAGQYSAEAGMGASLASIGLIGGIRQLSPEGGEGGNGLSAEETALLNKVRSAANEAIKNNNTELEKKFNDLADQIKKGPADYETLKAEHVTLMAELKAMKETPKAEEKKSFVQIIREAFSSKKSELDAIKNNRSGSVNMTIKAAGTLTTSNVDAVGTNSLSMLLNNFEPGITPIPRIQAFFRNLFNAVGVTGSTVSYAEMKNPDGGAGMTAEGGAKTQADFDIVEAKADVKKVTAYIKTSKEALDDIVALSGEINNELVTLVNLKIDSQLMTGDNTGNNLNGAITQAQAFTGGDLAGTIPAPNNYDVLVAAITEIATAEVVSGEPAGFMANVIVMNPVDVAAMKLTKDSNNQYIFPVTLPGTTTVMELPIVSHPRMTAGDFLVMDSTKGNLRIREDINLNIGYDQDDFTKNLVTILAEARLAFYIKSNHVKAFVTGDFESAKALLATV